MTGSHRNSIAELARKIRILYGDPTVAQVRLNNHSASIASKTEKSLEKARANREERARKAEIEFVKAGAAINFEGTETLMSAPGKNGGSKFTEMGPLSAYPLEHQRMMIPKIRALEDAYNGVQEITEAIQEARNTTVEAVTRASEARESLAEEHPWIQESNHAIRSHLGFEPWSKAAAVRTDPNVGRLKSLSGAQRRDKRREKGWRKQLARRESHQGPLDNKVKKALEKNPASSNSPNDPKISYEHNGQKHYFSPNKWHPAPARAEQNSRQSNVLRLNLALAERRMEGRQAVGSTLLDAINENHQGLGNSRAVRRAGSGIIQEQQVAREM